MSVMVGLNMRDWTSFSSPLGLSDPSPFGQCALARRGGPGGLAPQAGNLGGPLASPGKQEGLAGRRPPNSISRQTQNLSCCQVNFVAGCSKKLSLRAFGQPTYFVSHVNNTGGHITAVGDGPKVCSNASSSPPDAAFWQQSVRAPCVTCQSMV